MAKIHSLTEHKVSTKFSQAFKNNKKKLETFIHCRGKSESEYETEKDENFYHFPVET
jgi:hypothetical protein